MFDVSNRNDTASGCFGSYYQRSARRGIKVIGSCGNVFNTIEELKASRWYDDAVKEAANYRMAYKSGVVPKCYGVTIVKTSQGYLPGIILQHVGTRLCDVACSQGLDNEAIYRHLKDTLATKSGVHHGDLHYGNITVDTDGKFYAIDFTPGCINSKPCNEEIRRVPQSKVRYKRSAIEQEMSMWKKVRQFMESRL